MATTNLRTKIPDFRGLDSIIILILRGGIIMSIGNCLEILSQAILVGTIVLGTLGEWLICYYYLYDCFC